MITTKTIYDELITIGKKKIDKELADYFDLGYTKQEIEYFHLSSMGFFEIRNCVLKYLSRVFDWNSENIESFHRDLNKYARGLLK